MSNMTPEKTFGQFLRLGRALSVLEVRLEAKPSTFLLSVEETTEQCQELFVLSATLVVYHHNFEPMQRRVLNILN